MIMFMSRWQLKTIGLVVSETKYDKNRFRHEAALLRRDKVEISFT